MWRGFERKQKQTIIQWKGRSEFVLFMQLYKSWSKSNSRRLNQRMVAQIRCLHLPVVGLSSLPWSWAAYIWWLWRSSLQCFLTLPSLEFTVRSEFSVSASRSSVSMFRRQRRRLGSVTRREFSNGEKQRVQRELNSTTLRQAFRLGQSYDPDGRSFHTYGFSVLISKSCKDYEWTELHTRAQLHLLLF